jgi:hypothetical protein
MNLPVNWLLQGFLMGVSLSLAVGIALAKAASAY